MLAATELFPILTPRSAKWNWAGSFDAVDACRRNQEKEIVEAQERELAQPAAKRDRSVEMDFWEARCIATDDPRP
jgi:hypothetical protein